MRATKHQTWRLSDRLLRSLQISYRMRPAAVLPELPNTGIALTRWRRLEGGQSHVMENPNSSYTLSLLLQPMCGRAWFGSTQVWSGPIKANTMRLTPPGVDPRWQSDGTFDFLLFTIPSQTVAMIAGGDAVHLHEQLRTNPPVYIRDDVALQIGASMLRACDGKQQYVRQFADGLGYALVAHVLDRYGRRASPSLFSLSSTKLRRVTQHVTDHFADELPVEELARVAGLSESQFAHAFSASIGVSPHRFITSVRIERARQMLADNRKSILTIALDCGFKDASHFARVFRATTGLRPKDFRRLQ